jgi:hypothetical protein
LADVYGNSTVTDCVLPRVTCMHRLLGVGSEIHTRESRALLAATTALLPIDTLRAQSPPNTGSTISIVLSHRSGCEGYL